MGSMKDAWARNAWWFTTKVVAVALVAALALAGAMFYSAGKQFTLTGLELFFSLTTVISLFINLWQISRDRFKHDPLKNSLIALFNDLKQRQLRAQERKLLIDSPSGRAADADSVKREFWDFAGETIHHFNQLKEHVVGAIKTLDPNISDDQIFRATEFGLNDGEREVARLGAAKFLDQMKDTPLAFPPNAGTTPPGPVRPPGQQ